MKISDSDIEMQASYQHEKKVEHSFKFSIQLLAVEEEEGKVVTDKDEQLGKGLPEVEALSLPEERQNQFSFSWFYNLIMGEIGLGSGQEDFDPFSFGHSKQPGQIQMTKECHSYFYEYERVDFSFSGGIKTDDGRSISLNHSYMMEREFEKEVHELEINQRPFIDPLVINFAKSAVELDKSQTFEFDLDNDGALDDIHFVQAGSGFLTLDKNQDGKVNQGSELFGTLSGNGFHELAEYDLDTNGWIDENDAVFNQLGLWTLDSEGERSVKSLAEADIGAIHLGHQSTPFHITDENNQALAFIRSSGLALSEEEGTVRTVQQIDLSV